MIWLIMNAYAKGMVLIKQKAVSIKIKQWVIYSLSTKANTKNSITQKYSLNDIPICKSIEDQQSIHKIKKYLLTSKLLNRESLQRLNLIKFYILKILLNASLFLITILNNQLKYSLLNKTLYWKREFLYFKYYKNSEY